MPITKRTIVIIVLVVCCAVVLAALYMFYFQFQQKNLPAGQQNAPSEEPATAPSTTQQQISTPIQPPQPTQPPEEQTLLNATFTSPYPVQWEYQGVQFAITGVSLDKETSKMTFYFKITNTNAFYTEAACSQFPANAVRWVPNESGDMIEPSSSKSYGCGLPANVTRSKNEEVYFDISSGSSPYTFTTGGASNIFFFVNILPGGTINIENISNEKSG